MKKSFLLSWAVLTSLSAPVLAEDPGHLTVEEADSTELTLYLDKALISQFFTDQSLNEGKLTLEGVGKDWLEGSVELKLRQGEQHFSPEKLWFRKGGLSRDSLYSKLVGKSVELIGGGINVPVQGELLVYKEGIALVQGNNGRQYVVDWNDAQGVRLASKAPVFTTGDYADRMVAEFAAVNAQGSLELSYLTSALSYTSHYRLFRDVAGVGELQRQFILHNHSMTSYTNTTVRLVSGQSVNRGVFFNDSGSFRSAMAMPEPQQVNERVGETLVTQLPNVIALKRKSTLQLTHYKQEAIAFDKLYVMDIYGRSQSSRGGELERPNLVLRFKAGEDLPSGRVEMYERSADGALILSGTAWLNETIKNDYASLAMGEALAVRVKRKKLDSQQRTDVVHSRWETTVYNDRAEDVTFILNDLDQGLLKLSNVEGGDLDGTSQIKVKVPAGGSQQVTYMATHGR